MFLTLLLSQQVWESKHKPFLFLDQWLQRASVRKRPDNMIACMVAIATLAGEVPAVVHNGCGVVSDMKAGLKKTSDGKASASDLNNDSQ